MSFCSTGLFTPDLAFTATVRGIIARFREPLKECVDDVVDVMERTITECANKVLDTHYLFFL